MLLRKLYLHPIPFSNHLKENLMQSKCGLWKICEEDDNFIFDETWRRDQLEDPEYDNYASEDEEQEEEEEALLDLDEEQDLDLDEEQDLDSDSELP